MNLAIVKPDHLGDLVLSSPAIRAMAASNPNAVLFVASRCLGLAKFLFPEVEVRVFDLPHLAKHAATDAAAPDFTEFDAVALLRRDGVMSPGWASLRMPRFAMFEDSHNVHQSLLDYGVACEFAPPYDIDALFYLHRADEIATRAAKAPTQVGFSIGSGFYANSWPLAHWIALGGALRARGCEVTVVYGPADLAAATVLAAGLGGAKHLAGDADYERFFDRVSALDLVIASDGGTAHLCSVAAPVMSIFGPSPVRRYAPTGRWNRAVTQLLGCSPCCQYDERVVNGCLTTECMGEIAPRDVLAAIDAQPMGLGARRYLRPGLTLFQAPSWSGREEAIRARELERRLWHGGTVGHV